MESRTEVLDAREAEAKQILFIHDIRRAIKHAVNGKRVISEKVNAMKFIIFEWTIKGSVSCLRLDTAGRTTQIKAANATAAINNKLSRSTRR